MFIFVGNVDINFKKSKQKRMQLCESKNDIKQKRQKDRKTERQKVRKTGRQKDRRKKNTIM
jgi:hypothetical protein